MYLFPVNWSVCGRSQIIQHFPAIPVWCLHSITQRHSASWKISHKCFQMQERKCYSAISLRIVQTFSTTKHASVSVFNFLFLLSKNVFQPLFLQAGLMWVESFGLARRRGAERRGLTAPAGLTAFRKYLYVSVGDPSQRATHLLSSAPVSNYSAVNHVISSYWCLPPTHRLIHWQQEQGVK